VSSSVREGLPGGISELFLFVFLQGGHGRKIGGSREE